MCEQNFSRRAGIVVSIENVNKKKYLGENIRYFPERGGS
jgi:hypothetical protein